MPTYAVDDISLGFTSLAFAFSYSDSANTSCRRKKYYTFEFFDDYR